MRSLTLYLIRQLLGPLLFITLGLAGIAWLSQSLRLIERVLTSGMPLARFFYLTVLILPNLFALILPVALYVAAIYAYQRLLRESELVVMSAAGLSPVKLARPALIVGVMVMAALYSSLLYFGPAGARQFRAEQTAFGGNLAQILLQEGVFNTPANGLTVFIRERLDESELKGILVHDSRVPQKPVTMMAEIGKLVDVNGSSRILLLNGNRQEMDQATGRGSLLYFERYVLNLDDFQKQAEQRWREPSERYLPELFFPDMTSPNDRAYRDRLIAEGHKRLSQPLIIPGLLLCALAFLLRGEYNRRGQARRVAYAAAFGLIIQAASLGVGFLAVRSLWIAPLLYAFPLILAGLGWAALAGKFSPRRPVILSQAASS